ncbi:MAG: serine hydrolase [Ferruginibacter sp.]|nr:serine hydrolase [Ferruginibacter sp.]
MKHPVKIVLCFLIISGFCLGAAAQRTDKKLTAKLQEMVQGFHGSIGLFVHDLRKDRVVAINADTIFPTASMVKIPILAGVMDKVVKGDLEFHQPLTYKDSLLYAGEDILGSFKADEKIELGKLVMLMLTTSDNTASLWLQSLAGGGIRINEILESNGLKDTRVNSRTPGREEARKQYGWGQTTPFEMATLIERIVKRSLINDSSSTKMLRLLGRNYWDEHAISQVPPEVFVASKNGAVDASRSEVLFVNGKNCSYIFCICTKNNLDQSWTNSNEAWALTTKISRLLWEWYN